MLKTKPPITMHYNNTQENIECMPFSKSKLHSLVNKISTNYFHQSIIP